MKLLTTNPVKMKKVWGGQRLGEKIGESWLISTHPDGNSISNPNINLDYLVKVIDTSDHLSVQVHPDNAYAKAHENSLGKSECWLILDSEEGAGIFLGFKAGVTKKEFQTAIDSGLDMSKFLNFYEVKRGDFFYVPAGAVHAIGKGVYLAEVQQSSGITYRVWDWDRMGDDGKPRELHIDKALDVLNFNSNFNNKIKTFIKSGLFELSQNQIVIENEYFKVLCIHMDQNQEINLNENESIMVIEGQIEILGQTFSKNDCFLCTEKGSTLIKTNSSRLLKISTSH